MINTLRELIMARYSNTTDCASLMCVVDSLSDGANNRPIRYPAKVFFIIHIGSS